MFFLFPLRQNLSLAIELIHFCTLLVPKANVRGVGKTYSGSHKIQSGITDVRTRPITGSLPVYVGSKIQSINSKNFIV